MNTKLLSVISLLVLAGCEFNEDFCTRDGELIAFSHFDGEDSPPPPYEQRYLRAYCNTDDALQTNFTQDTLRWKIPQGKYNFIFYTGDYRLENGNDYHESILRALTDTVNGRVRISIPQKVCHVSLFSKELKYRESVWQQISPSLFTQQLHIRLSLSGNISPISSIEGEISDAACGKFLVSRNRTGAADIVCHFKRTDNGTWTSSLHTFGFMPSDNNILTLDFKMKEEYSFYSERKKIDLSKYLKSFDGPELYLELSVGVGTEITIKEPIAIPKWEDSPEIVLP